MPATTSNTAPAMVSAGLLNDWLRQESPAFSNWDLGGQERARFESKHYFAVPGAGPGAVDFARATPVPDNNYLLLRTRVHVGYQPCEWASAFAEGQNSSSTGDERNPNPESDGPFDLHQGYVTLGNPKAFPVTAKVGRQELILGDERLVGASDWNNIGRVFDAAKVRSQSASLTLDAFTGRVVIPDDNHFDQPNYYDWFSGAYASTRTLVPRQTTQLYFLARNTGSDSPQVIRTGGRGVSPRDIYTLGGRVQSLPGQWDGWDYEAELAGQFGRFQYTAAGPSLDQLAFAAHLAGGYTWTNLFGTPRAGLEYNYASGDANPSDGKHGTFDSLFPSNHKFYGYMDFVSWQNIHNLRGTASMKPVAGLTVTLDYHAFWLANTADAFYQVSGTPRGNVNAGATGIAANPNGYGANSGYDSYVGSEVDFVVSYALKPYAVFQAGYGHFFAGQYLESTLRNSGGAADANYFYVQATLRF